MASVKPNNSEVKRPKGNPHRQGQDPLGPTLKNLLILQALVIVILLINSVLLLAIWRGSTSQPAVLTVVSEDQIVLDVDQVVNQTITYNVYIDLKNTGGDIARVSATGEVLVSLYGSAYGEEVQKVLDYVYESISPGDTKRLAFGSFTTSPGWHYVVQVHVTWNGGTLELTRLVI